MEIQKGKIINFIGSWGSGIAQLEIQKDSGLIININCENTSTVRALDGAFGNVIDNNHSVNNKAIKGKEIFFSVSEWGILEGFTPVEEASTELLEQFNKQNKGVKK